MKLIIEIPDSYNLDGIRNGSIYSQLVLNAVKNGTPISDNAKNGEVIQMIFPNGVMLDKDECVGFEIMLDDKHSYCSFFDYIWWNAPYQKGGKNEVN